jgi:hypothetical protein
MWSTIATFIVTVQAWLPAITVVLKFCTALVSFTTTVSLLLHHARRWLNQRESAMHRPTVDPLRPHRVARARRVRSR